MCREKAEEDGSPWLRITLMDQLKLSRSSIKKSKEILITVACNSSSRETAKTKNKKQTNVEERQLYGDFEQQTLEIAHEENLHIAKKEKP